MANKESETLNLQLKLEELAKARPDAIRNRASWVVDHRGKVRPLIEQLHLFYKAPEAMNDARTMLEDGRMTIAEFVRALDGAAGRSDTSTRSDDH